MHTYLNIDRVMGFPVQPISYSSETNVSDRGVSVRVAIHHYPPVKPMIIEAPEMILELRATVDFNGRMEYQLSNYFANPTDLKALAKHLPEGSCLILQEDSSLTVESLDEPGMESSEEKSYNTSSTIGADDQMVGGGIGTSDVATGLSFITGGAEIQLNRKLKTFRPIRYNDASLMREGSIAKNLRSGSLMKGSKYLQSARGILYWTGFTSGIFSLGLSTYNYMNGDISGAKYGSDMFFGVVGFMGAPGLLVSGVYSIVTSPEFEQAVKDYEIQKNKDFGSGGDWEHVNSDFFYRGGLCFAEGTKVTMGNDSLKAIELISVGDIVLSYDFLNEKVIKVEVLKVDAPMHDNLIQITFSNKTRNTNTQDHPYFVKDKGWCSFNPIQSNKRYGLSTAKLEIGDECLVYKKGKINRVKIISILQQKGVVKTYNLTSLKDGDSYFVNGILVNNENPKENKDSEKIIEENK
ncbi:hypothetical protein [Labilibaculum antarcticum]|nr:hypothetical protein [Labilibaculum antarcticum]